MIHPAGPRFPESRGQPFLPASPAKAVSCHAPGGGVKVQATEGFTHTLRTRAPPGPVSAPQQPEIAKSSLSRAEGEALRTRFELEKARKTSETGGAGWGDGS